MQQSANWPGAECRPNSKSCQTDSKKNDKRSIRFPDPWCTTHPCWCGRENVSDKITRILHNTLTNTHETWQEYINPALCWTQKTNQEQNANLFYKRCHTDREQNDKRSPDHGAQLLQSTDIAGLSNSKARQTVCGRLARDQKPGLSNHSRAEWQSSPLVEPSGAKARTCPGQNMVHGGKFRLLGPCQDPFFTVSCAGTCWRLGIFRRTHQDPWTSSRPVVTKSRPHQPTRTSTKA